MFSSLARVFVNVSHFNHSLILEGKAGAHPQTLKVTKSDEHSSLFQKLIPINLYSLGHLGPVLQKFLRP
jgi:hypothetical protein